MADDLSDIAAHYDDELERERSRLDRHQLEHDLTWHYLDQYLPVQGSILEVGAATGTYTLELAKRGYNLTSVDLSATLLDECRVRLADEGLQEQVRLAVADARDLSRITERGFDAALLMGPLHEALGFETLVLAGVEPAISADDECYNRLEGEQRRLWLDLLYEISTDESTIGASRHLLYIGRKGL